MMKREHDSILEEQERYYRERAGEYDKWFLREGRHDLGPEGNAVWFAEVEEVRRALAAAEPEGAILELACGTGQWTKELLPYADELTALDAVPQVLEINRARPGHDAIRFIEADVFSWEPDRRYDFLFFGFWLSHVPPERFEEFWALVDRALAPGGGVFFLDNLRNPEATAAGHDLGPPGSNTLTRTLEDGRSFEIVKVFYEPEELEQRLYQLGWIFAVRQTAEHFLVANGMRGRIEPIERQS